MRGRFLALAIILGAGMALAACGGGSSSGSKGDVNTAFNKTLNATILVDSRGRSLYVFAQDAGGSPTCYDDPTYHCSKAWPPLLAHGMPRAGKGVDASMLKTVKRTGGSLQVTYNHQPLYLFNGYHGAEAPAAAADVKAGDVHGQSYIGAWWVLSPAGKTITKATPSGY